MVFCKAKAIQRGTITSPRLDFRTTYNLHLQPESVDNSLIAFINLVGIPCFQLFLSRTIPLFGKHTASSFSLISQILVFYAKK